MVQCWTDTEAIIAHGKHCSQKEPQNSTVSVHNRESTDSEFRHNASLVGDEHWQLSNLNYMPHCANFPPASGREDVYFLATTSYQKLTSLPLE